MQVSISAGKLPEPKRTFVTSERKVAKSDLADLGAKCSEWQE